MRFLISIVFLTTSLYFGSALAQEATGGSSGSTDSKEEKSPEKEAMDTLAASAFQMAFQALSKGGNFYPFAMYREDGEIKTHAFNLRGDQDPPPPQKWFKHLFSEMRTKVKEEAAVDVVVLARMHRAEGSEKTAEGEKKKDVPGVWMLIDHRDTNPVVAFIPLVPQEDGSHKPGNMIYSGTDNWIFPSSKGNRDD